MKKVLSLVLCCLSAGFVFSQQDKQFTHYMFDRMSYNPATTGFKGYCGTLIYRNQWDRVQDAPNSTLFNAQANLQNLKVGPGAIGVGLSFVNDAIGYQRNNNLTLNGAYHLPTPFGTLSGGIGLGFVNVGFSPNWVTPQVAADMDPSIAPINVNASQLGFDMNFGLYWYGREDYFVGISSTHLTETDLDQVSFSTRRHYYVLGGYKRMISDDFGWGTPVELKPTVLLKADGSTMVFDLNVMADVWLNPQQFFWGGASYRMSDAFALMVGYGFSPKANMKEDVLKIGYSFDIMTNPLDPYGRGTHELMVNYCMFPPAPPIKRHGNPFLLR